LIPALTVLPQQQKHPTVNWVVSTSRVADGNDNNLAQRLQFHPLRAISLLLARRTDGAVGKARATLLVPLPEQQHR